jgi:hypothetical protein
MIALAILAAGLMAYVPRAAQLADDDVDGDAGEKAGGDRNRKQRSEPAGSQQARVTRVACISPRSILGGESYASRTAL